MDRSQFYSASHTFSKIWTFSSSLSAWESELKLQQYEDVNASLCTRWQRKWKCKLSLEKSLSLLVNVFWSRANFECCRGVMFIRSFRLCLILEKSFSFWTNNFCDLRRNICEIRWILFSGYSSLDIKQSYNWIGVSVT